MEYQLNKPDWLREWETCNHVAAEIKQKGENMAPLLEKCDSALPTACAKAHEWTKPSRNIFMSW